MNLAKEFKARALVEYVSGDISQILGSPRTAYLGIDPTADSLHIGHLVPILLMKRLGDAGHKLVFLIGGGTGMIGDPRESGERVLLDDATVAKNTKALQKQLKSLLGGVSFRMVNNADWLSKVQLIPFLRDIGKHFSVNDLIKRDLIAKRLETPDESISYTEFTYALLQGFDYLKLNEKYGVDLQVGASDQWTNILSGVDLIRRKAGKEVYAMCVPLITDASGKKFGKSEGNAIWIDPTKTSPFQFYQYWINLPDQNLETYFKVYTTLPLADIEALMQKHQAAPQDREAQETLASLITTLVHGPAATAQAAAATDALYGGRTFAELSSIERQAALAAAPRLQLHKQEVAHGYLLIDALVMGGLASSKSDARRLLEAKSITLNDIKPTDVEPKLFPGDFINNLALIRKGKRDVLLISIR